MVHYMRLVSYMLSGYLGYRGHKGYLLSPKPVHDMQKLWAKFNSKWWKYPVGTSEGLIVFRTMLPHFQGDQGSQHHKQKSLLSP